jgi:hypothetical protein
VTVGLRSFSNEIEVLAFMEGCHLDIDDVIIICPFVMWFVFFKKNEYTEQRRCPTCSVNTQSERCERCYSKVAP